ncbi:putative bifunctional diguanylate cyclase/phosphodiesterase [Neomegalonema perideroedes]|uniref:putative bifunctional diguanylate cyclase/phosphodiesterase n=1 Tax=Neomegalonema perideroedes TaxID=217219 RepID=UPI000360FA80|nr:bifunctional diguanylate cyclase/phosphodiesterase [Neomegalonema perideroedes]
MSESFAAQTPQQTENAQACGRKPISVILKLLIVVIALTCAVQAGAGFVIAFGNSEKARAQFDEKLEYFLQARVELLGGLVWRLQYDELDRVLNAMLREEAVASIRVYDDVGSVVGEVGRPVEPQTPTIRRRADLIYMNGLVSDKAGWVEVLASMGPVHAAFEREKRHAVVLMLTSAAAIVTAVWLAVSRLIAQPLAQLRGAIARSLAGERNVRLPERSLDEVGELFSAFNQFMEANDRSLSKIRAANDRLRDLAERDDLTGLLNRRAAQAHFAELRGATGVSIVFIDIDLFKSVNELLGHKGGDTLLCDMVARLTREMSEEAEAYRLGGDEFLIIQRNVGSSGCAYAFAERLRQAVSGEYHIGVMAHDVTISLGVYYADQPLEDFDMVVAMSDLALRQAKHEGRGRTTLLTIDLLKAATARIEIERNVAQALAEGQFEMFFQTQLDLRSGKVVGVEALARWRHPQRGLVSPGVFMPIIEDMGLSVEHGRLAVLQCCAAAERLQAEFRRPIPVALNVNAQQVVQAEFWTTLQRELESRGLSASAIVIEITESQLIVNMEAACRALDDYRAVGGSVALDDFGTGYSSLAYLTQLPIDKVKIDRSFVKRAPTDRTVATILSVAAQLAQAIGAEVIAEGVETPEEEEAVSRHGVHLAQGFRYGRPVEIEVLMREIQERETAAFLNPATRVS